MITTKHYVFLAKLAYRFRCAIIITRLNSNSITDDDNFTSDDLVLIRSSGGASYNEYEELLAEFPTPAERAQLASTPRYKRLKQVLRAILREQLSEIYRRSWHEDWSTLFKQALLDRGRHAFEYREACRIQALFRGTLVRKMLRLRRIDEQFRALTSTAAERKRTVAACRTLWAQITQFEDSFIHMHGHAPRGAAERAPLASTYVQYREWKRAIRADAACRIQARFRGTLVRQMLRLRRIVSLIECAFIDAFIIAFFILFSVEVVMVIWRSLHPILSCMGLFGQTTNTLEFIISFIGAFAISVYRRHF